ncbi:DUF4328 domain-containing protein [Kitasatospora sp. NPDC057512]|uniref:DUF4328 domain-containing protein n=1 Tax=Kitasatospora sp. NPDC057512 TaxID=3346154 RepID=UPI00368511AE
MDSSQRYRAVAGWGVAASILVVVVMVYNVLVTWTDWRAYLVFEDALAGKATLADLQAVEDWADFFGDSLYLALALPAGIVVTVWLWRARINAELLGGPGSQRRARAWVVGGWWPLANLWIPYQVISDIWQASAPRRPVSRALIGVWSAAWVIWLYVSRGYAYLVDKDTPTEDDLRRAIAYSTIAAVANVVSGVILLHVVHRVSTWQTQRRAEARR